MSHGVARATEGRKAEEIEALNASGNAAKGGGTESDAVVQQRARHVRRPDLGVGDLREERHLRVEHDGGGHVARQHDDEARRVEEERDPIVFGEREDRRGGVDERNEDRADEQPGDVGLADELERPGVLCRGPGQCLHRMSDEVDDCLHRMSDEVDGEREKNHCGEDDDQGKEAAACWVGVQCSCSIGRVLSRAVGGSSRQGDGSVVVVD